MLTIKKVLEYAGLDTTKRIKIARHQDTRGIDVHQLLATGHFEIYQSYQETNKFKDCDYLISCLGLNNNQALFIGVYKIINTIPVSKFPPKYNSIFEGKAKLDTKYYYELEKLPGFEELENRLVIDWVTIGRVWCMKLDTYDQEVIQLLPKGYVGEFPGYLELNLYYKDLNDMINNPNANNIWKTMLSSVGGVYLILDTTDGMLYIGSASGNEGIYGRWKEYAKTGHGGNKKIKTILDKNPSRVHRFKFSILQTLPRTLTKKEVLSEEKKYKDKLGSRAYGLNLN